MIIVLLMLCIFPVYSFSLDQNEAALIITRAVALKALNNIVLKNGPSTINSFKNFSIFDDTIDTEKCHQDILARNNIERYKLARAAIKSGHNFFLLGGEKLVHIVTIDKDGMHFSYQAIRKEIRKENSNFSYVMKPTQLDKEGNLLIVRLKKRNENLNALKNPDGSYIFEEE